MIFKKVLITLYELLLRLSMSNVYASKRNSFIKVTGTAQEMCLIVEMEGKMGRKCK